MIHSVRRCLPALRRKIRGVVTIEYLLLLTLVGIGVIVGLSTLRDALINELNDLAAAINAIKEDPYGIAVDTALYPAFPIAASAGDFAAMRGGARQLSPYTRGDAEAAKAKAMVDALSVLPLGGGMAGRRLTRRR